MKSKPYWEMTPKELAAATKEFDKDCVADQSRPLTPAEREQWKRVKRQRGRLRADHGFKRITVRLEPALVKRATAVAKRRGISRSKLFAQMLESMLALEK